MGDIQKFQLKLTQMKKLFVALLPLLFLSVSVHSQQSESLYIEWFGEDTIANTMIWHGIDYAMNIENEKAVTMLEAGLKHDPSLFAPHVQLAMLSGGEKRAQHKAMAKKLVVGKNEVSKLFVSLLDIDWATPDAGDQWRSTWKKMFVLAYDGGYVHFRYAMSLQDPDERRSEFEKLFAKNEAAGMEIGHIHNLLGYGYYTQGDKEKAKMHFEKYLELRPDGYNAYDSMAEFYRNEGDLEKSLEYYEKARNHYGGAINARTAIEELETEIANKDKGNLLVMQSEYVIPEYMDEYMQWGKEYKELAAKTNFRGFYVSAGDGAFHYIVNVGKEMSGIDEYDEEWEQWGKDNPEVGAMFDKYKHTISKSESLVWRHMPAHSYSPKEAGDTLQTYSRVYFAYPKVGHKDKLKDLISQFKTIWENSGVTQGWQVYENVYGKEAGCVAIVSSFDSPKGWMADEEDVKTKVDKEKLKNLMSEWGKHIRKGENAERYPQPDLSHSNPQ